MSAIKTKHAPHLVSRALLLYYQGNSQEVVSALLRAKHKVTIPRRTIGKWITKYTSVCTFHHLRKAALTRFASSQLVTKHTLEHQQVYIYKQHNGKLAVLPSTLSPTTARRLTSYLADIMKPGYPHSIFRAPTSQEALQQFEQPLRSSQLTFQTLPIVTTTKSNTANDLATLGLFLAKKTTQRHPMIEDFMLSCDARTIAIEVPVYLQKEGITYFQDKGFYLPVDPANAPITGHIDLLQIRNGLIHILDYKPNARKIRPVNQLLLYALALASRTRLPLKTFACAWFDEKDYFSFYPLHAVYQKRAKKSPLLETSAEAII